MRARPRLNQYIDGAIFSTNIWFFFIVKHIYNYTKCIGYRSERARTYTHTYNQESIYYVAERKKKKKNWKGKHVKTNTFVVCIEEVKNKKKCIDE